MATLTLTATPSNGLLRYELTIDGTDVSMPGDTGQIEVAGACGDRSKHRLTYALFGPVGAKLRVSIACDGNEIARTREIEIYNEGEPGAAGWLDFVL